MVDEIGDLPTFSIITCCMGRLEHLKQSLPRMMDQGDTEVVVVDFSCPEDTATYVRENFPQAKVVSINNRLTFAAWEARNAGAAVATGKWLVFVDADTILSPNSLNLLANKLQPDSFAKFASGRNLQVHKSLTSPLSLNSLRGFMLVERDAFKKLGGYDEVLKGYGAGGDVEFDYRLQYFGYNPVMIPESIVDRVIHHGDELRLANAGLSLVDSYMRGRVYLQIKRTIMGFFGRNPPPPVQRNIYQAATKLSKSTLKNNGSGSINFGFHKIKVKIDENTPEMTFKLSINVSVDLDDN
ncbi:MAG: glycosyltransferase [Hyphomicrobiales bacterium]|nr:glycosyltransferase [Hyphomicrobiales bacterium]